MDFSEIPTETLAQWYRLALLLKGRPEAAEAVLLATCRELQGMLDELRSEESQRVFLTLHLRTRCLELTPEPDQPDPGTPPIAAAVSAMPEPTRSAVAMFYLKVLPVAEIAAILNLSLDQLADALGDGRAMLREVGLVDGASFPAPEP